MTTTGVLNVAFQEEKENLDAIEKRIDNIILEKNIQLDKIQSEIDDFYVLDKEDLRNKQYLIERKWRDSSKIEELEDYKPSPYFGRFDVENGDDEEVFFIGKNELTDKGDVIIIDWKSPIATIFYDKRSREFNIKGDDLKLLLRRSVDIKNAELLAVNTEYDSLDLTLDGDVIDPFLISVLKDKRRNYKLTDIIKTIQSNQNDIIRKPMNENFVVQGCAGSGKTMILLHRLAFIAFNYPDISFSRFCILTPNENFNLHIDDLSKELGVDKIKKYTVESFYVTLINSRSHTDNVSSSKTSKLIQKIPAFTEDYVSEKSLNKDLLEYLYSEELYDFIKDTYWRNSEDAANQLNDLKVVDILKRFGKRVDVVIDMNYKSYALYHSALNDVISQQGKAYSELNSQSEITLLQEDRVTRLAKDVEVLSSRLLKDKNGLLSICTEQINSSKQETDTLKNSIQSINDKLEPITAERDDTREKIRELELSTNIENYDVESITSYEYLSTHTDYLTELLKESFREEYSELERINEQINSLAFYNFGRKARARSELKEKEVLFSEKAKDLIEKYDQNKNARIKNLIEKEALLCDTIISLKNQKEEKTIKLEKIEKTNNQLYKCITILESLEIPDISNFSEFDSFQPIEKLSVQYKNTYKRLTESKKDLKIQQRILDSERAKLNELKGIVLPEEEIDKLNEAMSIVNDFDMAVLYKDFEEMLQSIYIDYGEKYKAKSNYRHKLYLKLLLCTLYYGPANNLGYYISIDEAQDLAKTEYKVLKEVLGSKTIFNLYGDVNQLIYDYKGIYDWDDLSNELPMELYLLNENYRNTIEITNYCNKEFDADITGIGLSGEEVRVLGFKEAVKRLETLHKDNPDYRCAIIYSNTLNAGIILEPVLTTNHIYGDVEKSVISIITVEESKGLEFDAVLVMQDGMTQNEKYISFTRALDNLIVTSIQ